MANAIRYIQLPDGTTLNVSIYGPPYGVCSTAADTQIKVLTISDITSLSTGLSVRVKFSYGQGYNGVPKLNLNSLGAKNIMRNANDNAALLEWDAGEIIDLVYDGTAWVMTNGNSIKGGTGSVQISAASGVSF